MICNLLLILLRSYIRLDNNTFFSLNQLYYILLHIDLVLIINFASFPLNIYLVFLVKSIIIAKNTKINKKQIEIMPRFSYTKYKVYRAIFKLLVFNLQRKSKKIVDKYHNYFCSIYIQIFKLQNLEALSTLKLIILHNINNKLYLDLLLFKNIAKRRQL